MNIENIKLHFYNKKYYYDVEQRIVVCVGKAKFYSSDDILEKLNLSNYTFTGKGIAKCRLFNEYDADAGAKIASTRLETDIYMKASVIITKKYDEYLTMFRILDNFINKSFKVKESNKKYLKIF